MTAVGVYCTSYNDFPLGQMFDKDLTFKCGQAPVHNYIDELLALVQQEKVVMDDIITHNLPLEEAPHGYKIFNDKKDDCVKVVLKP